MSARAVNVNSVGYSSPLTHLARLPGEPDQPGVGGAVRREAAVVDPLATNSSAEEPLETRFSYEYAPAPDPFDVAVKQFLSLCRTQPIDTTGTYSLQQLANGGAWTKVVELTSSSPDPNAYRTSSNLLTLTWQLRLEGMFRLKLFDEISQEVATILGEEEKVSRDGTSDISLSMRLLSCEIKIMTGRCDEAVEQLLVLRRWIVGKSIDNSATWDLRFQSAIVNAYIRMRQWRLAIMELRSALHDFSNKFAVQPGEVVTAKLSLLCLLARVLLQVGAVDASTRCGNEAWTLFSDEIGHAIPEVTNARACIQWIQVYTTRGLVFFGNDQFEDASKIFKIVLDCERNWTFQRSQVIPERFFPISEGFIHPFLFSDFQNSSLAIAVNNYCICQLYLKQVKDAISTLESLIQENPSQHLVDPIVFNLCTLYDLSCSPDASTVKKKVLQQVATQYRIEEQRLYWQSFRLN